MIRVYLEMPNRLEGAKIVSKQIIEWGAEYWLEETSGAIKIVNKGVANEWTHINAFLAKDYRIHEFPVNSPTEEAPKPLLEAVPPQVAKKKKR